MKDEILINRYLDKEVNPKEMKEVEVRLANDPKFASLFKNLEEVENLLEKVENRPVPDDIYKRVLSSVKYRTKAKPFYVRFAPALIGSAMSFALGIMFSSFLFTSQIANVNTENSSTYSTDLYSTLDMDEVMNYYYGD
jgi:anti-sigma factor RsiW